MRRLGFTLGPVCAVLVMLGATSAQAAYWNLFNIEGESSMTAQYATYSSLNDMLADTNRTGVFDPNGFGAGRNVVGSGSNGSTYWNLFNFEGESSITAQYVTYASLNDMLSDTNRTGLFDPDGFGVGRNVIDGGSDSFRVSAVPVPAAFPMFGAGLLALGVISYRKRSKAKLA